jgi:hypothetical protein
VKTADTIRVDQIADSVGKEIKLNPQNKRIRAYHYKNEKQEIYYFVNEDEAEKSVFRIWNPATPMMHGMEQRWLRNIEQKRKTQRSCQ